MVFSLLDVRKQVRYALPLPDGGLNTRASRQDLYRTMESYYYNTIYEELGLEAFNVTLAAKAESVTLRGIYNPVPDIVAFYQKYVLTGRIGDESDDVDLTIDTKNARIIAPLLEVWQWSNLQTEKDLIPFYAANLGDCLLAVVDRAPERAARGAVKPGKVWIEIRHPGELVDYDFDERGNFTYAKLESIAYERDASGRKVAYVYGRVLTKSEYRTEKDRQPYAYRADGLAAWPNPHGFVPLVLVQHGRIGDEFGVNAYHHGIAPINELNLQASYLSTLLSQHLAPQWAIFGATVAPDGLPSDGRIWGFPSGTDAKAIIADLRVADAYEHLNAIRKHLEDLFPELAIPRLREKGQLSGVAVRGMLTDLIRNGELARDNYEAGLVRAGQMALTMGQNVSGSGQALDGWRGIGTYEAGALDHRYRWPPILPLSELEQLQVDAEKQALKRELAIGNPATQAPFVVAPASAGAAAVPLTPAQALARQLGS